MRAEARTKKVDKCFSAAKFSESSSSRLIGGDDLEYESLHMGRISRFDFHQYVVSNQFNLLLKLSMPELALMRAYSFITATHKYLSAQFNRENPMFVDGWVFSAALAASNTCNFYISCTKSDNSHSESYLKIADMFLEARNELKRFGLSRGLLDSSASSTFGMLKAAFAMTGNNFEPSPQQVEAINTVVTAATDDVTTTGTESEQQQKEEASSVPPKKLDDTEGYMNEPNTDYITKALEDYMSSAHKQILSSSMPPSSGTTGQQDQNQGQQQQQQQLPQPLSNSTSSRRVSFNFKMRSSHSTTLELQRGISSGSPGSGDETPRSAKRSVFASPAAVAAAAALTSVRSCKNSVDDEMLAIEQFYATVPPPPPLPQDKDDLARFKDNPILVDALKSVESFDSILIGVSEKAQKAYNMANRPRASLNLFCEVALLYLYIKTTTTTT